MLHNRKGSWIWQDVLNGMKKWQLYRCVFFLPQAAMNVEHEVNLLVEEIHRLGSKSKYYNTNTVLPLHLPPSK